MEERISKLKSLLRGLGLDAVLISSPANIYYLSGFTGTDSYSIITRSKNFLITDFRYAQQAEKETSGFEVVYKPSSIFKKTAELIKKESLKRIGFESHHLTFKEQEVISESLGRRLYPTFQVVERLRIIKDNSEIELIARAARISRDVLKKTIKDIRKGDTEREVALKIDFLFRKNGAEASAFDTIVASGPNASMPHAKTTDKKIKPLEPIIIDCGARLNGYNSDLTRTHFVDKIDARSKLIYNIVLKAQALAIEKVKPGIKISEVDRAARGYISKKGLAGHFGHSTGHGIGIEVHELPSINPKNHAILKEGMVFSIEPAIYIPGWGGIRIEDMVLVTGKGFRVLTR